MKRYEELDIARGLCMLLVFLDHSVLYFPLDYREMYPICDYLIRIVSSWHMPCFFVISGILFASCDHSYKETVISKTKRLLLPYICVCALTMCMKLVIPQFAAFTQETWTERLYYYLLDGGDRWFLYVLFVIFLAITPFKNRLSYSAFNCILAILLFISFSETQWISDIRILRKIFVFSGFFVAGMLVHKDYIKIKETLYAHRKLIMILFALFNIFLDYFYQGEFWKYTLAFTGVMACLSLSIALSFNTIKKNAVLQYFIHLGKYSLWYYVLTGFVLVVARYVMVTMLGVINPIIVIPSVFIIQLFLASFTIVVARSIIVKCQKF